MKDAFDLARHVDSLFRARRERLVHPAFVVEDGTRRVEVCEPERAALQAGTRMGAVSPEWNVVIFEAQPGERILLAPPESESFRSRWHCAAMALVERHHFEACCAAIPEAYERWVAAMQRLIERVANGLNGGQMPSTRAIRTETRARCADRAMAQRLLADFRAGRPIDLSRSPSTPVEVARTARYLVRMQERLAAYRAHCLEAEAEAASRVEAERDASLARMAEAEEKARADAEVAEMVESGDDLRMATLA